MLEANRSVFVCFQVLASAGCAVASQALLTMFVRFNKTHLKLLTGRATFPLFMTLLAIPILDSSFDPSSPMPVPTPSLSPPPPPPCVTFRLVVAPLRGPGQSPVLPFACCVGSLLSVGRCGRCSCCCRFRVRGAQYLVCWGCAECGMVCHLRVSGAQ